MYEIAIAEDVEEQALLLKQKIESDAGFQGECLSFLSFWGLAL